MADMSLFHRKRPRTTTESKAIYVGKLKLSRYRKALQDPEVRATLREAAATKVARSK